MELKTPNHGLPLGTVGSVETKQSLVEGFKKIDALIPAFTADDIGKTLKVVDDGSGKPTLSWEASA